MVDFYYSFSQSEAVQLFWDSCLAESLHIELPGKFKNCRMLVMVRSGLHTGLFLHAVCECQEENTLP